MGNFELAVAHVLKAEGGYSAHPLDKGRETNFGITRATLEVFRGRTVSAEDVKALTKDEAIAIYKKFYWDHYGLELVIHPMIALVLFDQIVNRRAAEVIRGLQATLNRSFGTDLKVDGVFGVKTADVLNKVRAEKLVIGLVIEAQNSYLEIVERAPSQTVFLKGWLARTWRLLDLV